MMKTIEQPQTVVDPLMAEVRRHKQEIAEAFGFDVMALGRALQEREHGDPRFKTPGSEQAEKGQSSARLELKSEGSDEH